MFWSWETPNEGMSCFYVVFLFRKMHQWFHQLITQLLSAKKSCLERKICVLWLKILEERALIQEASKICALPSSLDCQAEKEEWHIKAEVTDEPMCHEYIHRNWISFKIRILLTLHELCIRTHPCALSEVNLNSNRVASGYLYTSKLDISPLTKTRHFPANSCRSLGPYLLGLFSLNPTDGCVRVKKQEWHFVRQSHQKTIATSPCPNARSRCCAIEVWLRCDSCWIFPPAFSHTFPSIHIALNGALDIFALQTQPNLSSAVSGRVLLLGVLVDTDEEPSVCMRRQENLSAGRRSAQPWLVST